METLPLTPEDIKLLKKQLIPAFIFPFIVMGILALIYVFVLSKMEGDFIIYILPVVGLIFFGIIGYIIWGLVMDIKKGVKYRICGHITDKRLNIHTSTNSNSKGSSRTTWTYYIAINAQEYVVDIKHYGKVKVGDEIVMDKAPKSDYTLKLEVIKSEPDEIISETNARVVQQFTTQKPIEQPMTVADLAALKRMTVSTLKAKVLWMTPFLFILYGLLSSDMWAFVVFMFPLVIIPAFQFYRICHTIFHYFRNKAYGQKVGIAALIQDKSTVTSNRSSTKQNIHTTWKTLSVPSAVFNQLSEQDQIIIFKPKYGKGVMSILTQNKEEVYLV